jgi:Tol biopolymer transport system component
MENGKWIVYTSVESNVHAKLYRKPSKGAEELLLSDDQVAVATDWSQDGKYLLNSRACRRSTGRFGLCR